jgi:hypothetical protein
MQIQDTTPEYHHAPRQPRRADLTALPVEGSTALLADAAARDQVTARRILLFKILWRERFLTREGLMARVKALLGRDCFGEAAWEDTFYRDMRAVKEAFGAAGDTVAYSRRSERPGYYLRGRPRVHPDVTRALEGAAGEVDRAQLAVLGRLSPADRFRQGSTISDTARRAVAHRLRERRPELDEWEAWRLAGEEGED